MRSWSYLASSSRTLARCNTSAVLPVTGATFHTLRPNVYKPVRELLQSPQSAAHPRASALLEQRRCFVGTRRLRVRDEQPRDKRLPPPPNASKKDPIGRQDATTESKAATSNASPRVDPDLTSALNSAHSQSEAPETDASLFPPTTTPSPDPPSSTAELPSESLSRRNNLTVRLQNLTDRLIASLSLASNRVNALTGTDYSGIAALRESIAQQARDVRDGHRALSKAREAHDTALSIQAASQKEVVQLLERKHSWSAADLERYMSLIRSEHTDEQSVAATREELEQCESRLESARQKVERAERKQYHEEQIWSDTIRRNSTWVTFGLMGLNILLLIVNLVMIEPWRRKRMVTEIRAALDEKTFAATALASSGPNVTVDTSETASGPSAAAIVVLDREGNAVYATDSAAVPQDASHAETIPGYAEDAASAASTDQPSIDEESHPRRFRDRILGSINYWCADVWGWANYMLSDEHHVMISRADFTTALVESWAVGATCMLLLFVTIPVDLSDVFR